MRQSLTSGLLSSVVLRDDTVNILTDKEAVALEAELHSVQAGMQSDTNDLNIICTAMNKAIELKTLFAKAVEDNANPTTVSMLLSEFSAIHKDALGTDIIFAKNLSAENAFTNLEAGLQSVSSFIDTLKSIAKKIWEAIVKAAKWFWSNIKKLITWLFGNRRKAEEKQNKNKAVKRFLIAADSASKTFKDKTSKIDSMTDDEVEILSDEIEEEMKTVFTEQYKEDGDLFKGINNVFQEAFDLMNKIDTSLTLAKISIKTSAAADRVAVNMINKIIDDKKLLNNISAIATIARVADIFEDAPIENKTYINKEFSLDSVLSKSYYNNDWRIRYAFNNIEEWPDKISSALNKMTKFKDKDARIWAINDIITSAFNIEAYDLLSGLGNGRDYGGGISQYLTKYLSRIYWSYNTAFKEINKESLIISNAALETSELHDALNSLDETNLLNDGTSYMGTGVGAIAAVPVKFSVSGDSVECDWINYLVSGSCKIDSIDQSYLKQEIEDILNPEDKDALIGRNFKVAQAIQAMKDGANNTKKLGTSNLEKDLINSVNELEKSYSTLLAEIDTYIKWFSEVDSTKLERDKDVFNNIFKVIQHINKIPASAPLIMVSQNQAILNSVIDSLDFENEVIKAFKEVLAEDKK